MANYAVPSDILTPFIPYNTVLDSFGEKTYVSLVGFMFMNTKMMGFTVPYHVNFEEVNLRFYVKNNTNGTWRKGVAFIKEIVPKPAIAFVANSIYKEKYSAMKMRHFQNDKGGAVETGYEWKFKNKWNKISAVSEKKSLPMRINSEEEFIADQCWGFSKISPVKTYEYEVQHPRWEISR